MVRAFLLLLCTIAGFAADVGLGPVPATVGINGQAIAPSSVTDSGLTATQVVYAGTGGLLTGDSGFTRASLAMTVDSGSDATYVFGNTKFGFPTSGISGSAYWGQVTAFSNGGYAIRQNTSGDTQLNAANGRSIFFSTNAGTRGTLTSTGFNLASGVPLTDSDTTDATSKTTGAIISSGGASAAKNIIAGQGLAQGVSTTATAAGTTTLTSASTGVQIFTGSTTQTVQLPAASLFGAGIAVQYTLINRSSGNVSWARAGSDTINGATSNVAVSSNTVGLIFSDGVSAWYTK